MDFKEIYKKYKDGTATDEEKAFVQEELEKYELLTGEYLDNDKSDILNESEEQTDDSYRKEIKRIKKLNGVWTARIIIISIVVICLLGAGFKYGLTPLINKHVFYNPEEKSYSEYLTDLEIEFKTLTSLHSPFMTVDYVSTELKGLGKYDLTLSVGNRDYFEKSPFYTDNDIKGEIVRGNIELDYKFYNLMPAGIFLSEGNGLSDKEVDEMNSETIGKLKKLPDDFSAARVIFSLEQNIDIEKLCSLIEKYRNINFEWAAISTNEESHHTYPMIGIPLDNSGPLYADEDLNDSIPVFREIENNKESLEKYLMNMLNFQVDNSELASKIMNRKDEDIINTESYKYDISYLEENGIEAFGLVLKGKPSQIISLYEELSVYNLNIEKITWDVE